MPIPLPGLTLALVIRDWWLSRNAHQHDASCDCSDYSPQHDKHGGLPTRAALQITLDQMLDPNTVVMDGDIPEELQLVFANPEFGMVRGVVVHDRMIDVHYTCGVMVQFLPVVGERYNGGV